MHTPTIQTERSLLRPFQESDAQDIATYMNDAEIGLYTSNTIPFPYTVDDAFSFIRTRSDKEDRVVWAVEYEGHVIGGFNFHDISVSNKTCKVGYLLAREHWGKGLATEALRAILSEAFSNMQMQRVEARVYHPNIRSQKLVEKFGFQREGVLRLSIRNRGQIFDEYVYGLLKDEFTFDP